MWTDADVAGAVNDHPDIAAETLSALQLSGDMPRLDAAGMGIAAARHGGSVGDAWVAVLEAFGVLDLFATGLAARGIAIDLTQPEPAPTSDPDQPADAEQADDSGEGGGATDEFAKFAQRVKAFQCRIKIGSAPAGSGVLIGPSSVLTAWHVIAAPGPTAADADVPATDIEVQFLSGLTVKAWQPPLAFSRCTRGEFEGKLPRNDAALMGHNDYAVLTLARPVGALLGVAALPSVPPKFKRHAGVIVAHYRSGVNPEVRVGSMKRVGRLTLRWGHTAPTNAGSSGGGCFDDQSYRIAGIHQGRDPKERGRLVPTSCFLTEVSAVVAMDLAPPRIWSLDGTAEGEFVIGRERFSAAFGQARKKDGRVRGVWTKRLDPTADLSGLPFTFRILDRLVARDPATRLCRLSFEGLVDDFAGEVARRVIDAGIAVEAIAPRAGVADGQSAPEAVGADRGRRIASAIGAAAADLGVQLWLFIDHPAIPFGDETRAALEAFVDQVLREPNLRLVIAGYETATLPGLMFNEPIQPQAGGVGLINDFIGNFAGSDVEVFIRNAAEAAKRTPSPERIAELTEQALDGLEHVNQSYRPWLAATVGERLRPHIRNLFA